MIPVDAARRRRSFVPVAIFAVGVFALSFYELEIDPLIGFLLKLTVFTCGIMAPRRTAIGAWRGEDRWRCRVACTVTFLIWAAWISGGVNVVARQAWFWKERAFFDRAVREAADGRVPSCVATKRCIHEPGRGADLAFPMGGILDNWYGVVHAPAWQDPSFDRDRSSFDGDLVGCDHLNGPYFICSFT
ncbi:hypothetical protein [Mitsuaria sp. 7]|uniref:hypothetical protein n=1 Tax=Mitsuaria sp. 7 TaxID=1658665 RepID=UPI0007DD1A9C|nr:hypothetical protein [Mitsuaria sp. 7]ANH69175.1 hypothetical protein ABE85_19290 [Mitsuaria sp. 7]